MARRNAFLAGLALALCAAPLWSATHPVVVEFSPSLPRAGQAVTARLSNGTSKACWPPATSITRENAVVTIRLDYDDACPTQYLLPSRDYPIGSFPPDNYSLVVNSCSNNPPPFPSECNIVLQAPFAVLPARNLDPAPAASPPVLLALLGGLVAIAAARLRRLRNRRRS